MIDSYMFEHADRDDSVVTPEFLAVIAQVESDAIGQPRGRSAEYRRLVLLGRERQTGHVGAAFAAAADTVEFGDACWSARRQHAGPLQADEAERATTATIELALADPAGQLLARQFLDQAVPGAAAVAAAGPFRVHGRALLTNKASLWPRHRFSPTALDLRSSCPRGSPSGSALRRGH